VTAEIEARGRIGGPYAAFKTAAGSHTVGVPKVAD
jgi:hypothetical protein